MAKDNLAVRVASDPALMRLYSKLKESHYSVPDYEDEIKKLRGIRATEKGVLVSKVTSVEDYQTQLKLLSILQHLLDRIHEINTDLYIIQSRYKEMHAAATKAVILTYFDELNELKDGVRKTVVQVALQPVQMGMDRLQHLIYLGESTQKHLMSSNWNVKEGSNIIKEYLSLFKFGSSVRIAPEEV